LAAGVAHEINNPTGFVASNLNTLGEYTADVSAVLKECGHLLSLCEELDGGTGEIAEKASKLWQECDLDYILGDLDNIIKESIEGTDRIRKIVADLKDFSRTDKHEVEEIDINEAIDKTLNVAWNEIKYKAEVVKEYGDLP
jgi:signal transduction histidine kinase